MTLAVTELGRWKEESEGLFSQALDTFPSRILASGEICPDTRKLTKRNGDMSERGIQAQAGQKDLAVSN